LEDLLKHTPLEDKQFHEKISEATDAIAMVAEYCNQKQHEFESLIRMTELYEKLDIDVILSIRQLN
jgi:predicted component of type VI protein secretion system